MLLFLSSKGSAIEMTTLFIAEKKAVAKAIATALSPQHTMKDGYIEGANGLVFTWAIGHLCTLKDPGEMKEEWQEWKWDTLPMLPASFQLKAINEPRSIKQLNVIKQLEKTAKTLINTTDSGQEGELIFTNISIFLRFNKPTYRLWTSSVQPAAIKKAYKEMKPSSAYESLRDAAMTRALSDWMIGLNATRALTLKSGGSTLNVGRIQTPVLALVYDRHMERSSFKKLKYYPVLANFKQGAVSYQGYLAGERITDKTHATSIAVQLKMKSGTVSSITEEMKQTPPPLLMDLTDISRIANQKFGYTGMKTLELVQELYLKKVVTYPRTGSRYITHDEIPLMHSSFDVLKEVFPTLSKEGNKNLINAQNRRIVKPEKVVDHHALLPEPVIATGLSNDEENVYKLIIERFFAQFQPPLQYKQKDIVTEVSNYSFHSRYQETTHLGWKSILSQEAAETESEDDLVGYPSIQEANSLCEDLLIEEKETAPPAAYTDGTLMDIMSNISNKIEDPELKEKLKDCGIGTVATRPPTIKKLVDTEYLVYEKKALSITKKGITLIELLRKTKIKLLTSPELTAQWEKELDLIRNGKSSKGFMEGITKFAHLIVDESKNVVVAAEDFKEFFGECPTCKKGILLSKGRYYCSGYKDGCKFFIWKSQYNKEITPQMLNLLLKKGKTNKLTFLAKSSTKDEKIQYKAYLKMPENIDNGRLELEFASKK